MKSFKKLRRTGARRVMTVGRSQSGTAMFIAIMVMALLAIFVAASLSRITNEALMMGNDQAESDAYFAAQASLEHVSRNFSDIFDVRITPTTTDIANIQNDKPVGYTGFTVTQTLARENPGSPPEQTTVDSGSPFAGLIALREGWRIDATAESPSGGEVRLTRTLNNYTIPIFQFGIFYDDPMEHHPGPAFAFGGRVHSNGDIYLMAGNTSTRFRDRVTAHGEVVTDVARNGWSWTHWGQHVYVKDGTTFQLVSEGSVIGGPRTPERIAETPNPATGVPPYNDTDVPAGTRNANWSTFSARFRGNLTARVSALKLPLQLGGSQPIEIIKRGLATDDTILRDSRYCNKPCMRVTLSDTQAKLPGGTGGVQLNATVQPNTANQVGGGAPGYWPTARPGGATRATKVNGYRLTGVPGRQVWIKVETVNIDSNLNPVATDVTEAILSLGMTDRQTIGTNNIAMGDTDAIIKIQRFAIAGPPLKVTDAAYFQSANSNAVAYTVTTDRAAQRTAGLRRNVYTFIPGASAAGGLNVVARDNVYINGTGEANLQYPISGSDPTMIVYAGVASGNPTPSGTAQATKLVPIPIMMFDTREGLYNDDLTNTGTPSWTSLYKGANSQRVPANGVMGLIDFDVANFRKLVTGTLDGTIVNGLRGSDIPDNNGIGWIVYFSDRRNDIDNDGQFDMENVYVANASDNSGFTPGEDVNHNQALDISYDNTGTGLGEGATYNKSDEADVLAVMDTPYFRRAQRLINGQLLPGTINKGMSVASENGVYIQGNYNASGVSVGMTGGNPTPYDQYINASGTMVPASVVADAVTILSNQWNDGKSFRWAFEFGTTALGGRIPTGDDTVRCALLMGDTLSFDQNNGPSQGGDTHLAGGVHNFKRFRESWSNTVNYCGSLINLFNSVGNNGTFKCCTHVYTPPTRNWVFDSNFLDPTRLPPGTPFFQYINLTGFRRTYRQDS